MTRESARTAAEVLEAVARWCGWEAQRCGEPHATGEPRIPTGADLRAAALPFAAVSSAVDAAGVLVGMPDLSLEVAPPDPPLPDVPGSIALYQAWLLIRAKRPGLAPSPDPARPDGSIEAVHAAWLAAGMPDPHPLAPLVDAWQRIPPVVEADERRHQNLPGALTRTRHVVPPADDDQSHLPLDFAGMSLAVPADEPRFEATHLPYMEPAPSILSTAMLDLLDFGASRGRNGPVPVPTRIGWELLLYPKPGDWHAEKATVTPTSGEIAGRVWPTTPYKATKHGPMLYQAARWLNDPDNATWWRRNEQSRPILVVTFFAPPAAPYHADQRMGAHVVLPDGGRRVGPQYDADLRRVLAATSYRQHRVYIAAVCLWDERATWRGRLVQLTLPVVRRDAAGYVLDAAGTVVSERGKPTRRPTHRRAVQTGAREANPHAAAAYPWLEGDDTILAAAFRPLPSRSHFAAHAERVEAREKARRQRGRG